MGPIGLGHRRAASLRLLEQLLLLGLSLSLFEGAILLGDLLVVGALPRFRGEVLELLGVLACVAQCRVDGEPRLSPDADSAR